MKRGLVCAVLAVGGCWGQGPGMRLHGPWLGMVFDEAAKGVRPVLGFPGAASLGQALQTPYALGQAEGAGRAEYALAEVQGGGVVVATALGANKIAELAAVKKLAFSPPGRTAAVYDGERIAVLTGLPDAPRVAFWLDATQVAGEITGLAVSESGLVIAATNRGTVWVLGNGRAARSILGTKQAGGVAFIAGSTDALATDRIDNLVYRINDAGGTAGIAIAASKDDGLAQPEAIATTADGKRAIVTNAGPTRARRIGRDQLQARVVLANSTVGRVVILELNGGPAHIVECACQSTVAAPMAGNGIFRLTGSGASPIWLLDAEKSEPRAFFVPGNLSGPETR